MQTQTWFLDFFNWASVGCNSLDLSKFLDFENFLKNSRKFSKIFFSNSYAAWLPCIFIPRQVYIFVTTHNTLNLSFQIFFIKFFTRFEHSGSLGQAGIWMKVISILFLAIFMPINAMTHWFLPNSRLGTFIASPYVKFVNHAVSFVLFLILLVTSSIDRNCFKY